MSGTSADGVDVVIASLEGTGADLHVEVRGHAHTAYSAEFREIVLDHALDRKSTVKSIAQLNVALAHVYREAVEACLETVGMNVGRLDLIGCHGQTVQHVPDPEPFADRRVASTLQLGDPAVLANLLGVPVVGNFRLPDMALGGQGAPLVPYFDYVAFSDPSEYRIMLNLGGIANLTYLPSGIGVEDVVAFDTGPANMLIDFLCEILFGIPFDEDGALAAQAEPDRDTMEPILEHEYFQRPPPKTTGRELFNDAFALDVCSRFESLHGPRNTWSDDVGRIVVSSLTWLTARSVATSLARWNPVAERPDVLIAAGGGTANPTLMRMLREEIGSIQLRSIDSFGIRSEEKESLCFAVLAHEFINEVPTGMPSVTGARHAALLGTLALPSPSTQP
jgi:anhydro-N-acetylmuramic acid kinase